MKGIIALDIDGTITHGHHTISPEVVMFLETLANEGWALIFITGRTFKWGFEVLQYLHCPYYFSVQNGAITLQMPEKKIIAKKYLEPTIFPMMEEACLTEPSDFVIYTGFENQDICFYRPHCFSNDLLRYLKERVRILDENWIALETFDSRVNREFASVKSFGTLQSASRIADHIEKSLGLHVPLVRDPFSDSFYVVQATHPLVTKGFAVQDFRRLIDPSAMIIAAGDDNNDRSMLEAADIKVVMATAPKELLAIADIIAPPAAEKGIIQGLREAIKD